MNSIGIFFGLLVLSQIILKTNDYILLSFYIDIDSLSKMITNKIINLVT